ncbi:MAG TPA: NIPSNAP family protein [Kofleriaceae bacterium]|nr:NIPSNAP family protein [Kofleriaceae bacterium]
MSQIVELRQYTLHPGRRDALIELFDRELVAPQDELGMTVLGQFRDLDDPDRFVWLRGFPDLATRAAKLAAFYGGPVWKAHREAANATMIDSDDVLLLRPVDDDRERPVVIGAPADGGIIAATVYLLRAPVDADFARLFDHRIAPVLAAAGAPPLARFTTADGKNEFPALPVREGEHAFVWLAAFASAADHAACQAALAAAGVSDELARRGVTTQALRLAPTAGSKLRPGAPLGYTTQRRGDVHDFDFLAGRWTVASRRLAARGAGSTTWQTTLATARAELHLGGVANVDEIELPALGAAGLTLRHFRIADRQWSIHWVSSHTGAIDPPVVGGFHGDRGEFYGEDVDAGRPVKVRFVWTRLGPDAARWEQAFAYAGGAWETNWIMEFQRAGQRP